MRKFNKTEKAAYYLQTRKGKVEEKKSTKGFAVYHCGQAVFTNSSPAVCRSFITQHHLKGATVGYAK